MSGWYPEAIIDRGPEWKQGYAFISNNLGVGVVLHSMVGKYSAARTRLMGEDRVSWHFSVLQSGQVIQHYPVRAVCWHAGSPAANEKYIGVEHEGGAYPHYSEPLTEAQLRASVKLVLWLMKELMWPEFRVGVQGMEHNWLSSTACPSGRIPWGAYVEAVTKEGSVDQELRDRVRVAAAFETAATAVLSGRDLKSALTDEQKNTILFVLKVAGIVR